ncbi:MAG: hypothetical protein ACE361_14560 [Aureliella sp.]
MTFNELDEEVEHNDEGIPGPVKVMALVAFLCLAGLVIFVAFSFEPEDPRIAEGKRFWNERDPSGDDDHETMRFVAEDPAYKPEMLPLSELPEPERERQVIGIQYDGVAHAHVIRPLEDKKNVYLAVSQIGDRAFLVMHNYRKDETRVMTSEDRELLMQTRFGGGDFLQNLVILLGETRYKQSSEKIPFEDYNFEKDTLENWVAQHPETLVNVDEELFENDFFERKKQ